MEKTDALSGAALETVVVAFARRLMEPDGEVGLVRPCGEKLL